MKRFWVRMTQLYPHKFTTTEGDYINEKNQYAENFKRWTNELAHFDAKAWKKAYTRIEADIKKAAHEGKDCWPPCSLAVIAYAEPGIGEQSFKDFDRATAVEDLTKKEERYKTGKEQCKSLLSLFD
jgi:hypothetical protein